MIETGRCEKCNKLVILPHVCPSEKIVMKKENKMVYDEMTGEMRKEGYDNSGYAKDGGHFYDNC